MSTEAKHGGLGGEIRKSALLMLLRLICLQSALLCKRHDGIIP